MSIIHKSPNTNRRLEDESAAQNPSLQSNGQTITIPGPEAQGVKEALYDLADMDAPHRAAAVEQLAFFKKLAPEQQDKVTQMMLHPHCREMIASPAVDAILTGAVSVSRVDTSGIQNGALAAGLGYGPAQSIPLLSFVLAVICLLALRRA